MRKSAKSLRSPFKIGNKSSDPTSAGGAEVGRFLDRFRPQARNRHEQGTTIGARIVDVEEFLKDPDHALAAARTEQGLRVDAADGTPLIMASSVPSSKFFAQAEDDDESNSPLEDDSPDASSGASTEWLE